MPHTYTEDQLIEQSVIGLFAEFESILSDMERIITPSPEKTIFGVGSRGYYENPTSDLLAFFMNPVAEHGFGKLFLSAFLECMDGPNLDGIISKDVEIGREVMTAEDKRIDFLITTPEWCLVIENKIYHDQVNPFDIYEAFARETHLDAYFAILSPNGKSTEEPLWKGVSYKTYLSALRKKLGEHAIDNPLSKWNVLAREFIIHIENELYRPLMNDEQIAFFEKHAEQIKQLKELESDYRNHLQSVLMTSLESKFPNQPFSIKDATWAIRCCSELWGSSNLVFWRRGGEFMITVYFLSPDETLRVQAKKQFCGMKYWKEDEWMAWYREPGFDSHDEAAEELLSLAEGLNDLLIPSCESNSPPEGSSPNEV